MYVVPDAKGCDLEPNNTEFAFGHFVNLDYKLKVINYVNFSFMHKAYWNPFMVRDMLRMFILAELMLRNGC